MSASERSASERSASERSASERSASERSASEREEGVAKSRPVIGIRDSGVGGLTVARAIREVLGDARLLYFADTAHVPYGDREPDEVKFFALSISRFLLEEGAQSLVFACNTTSAYALEDARAMFPVPVTGMIEPGARAALEATRTGRIGVLATQATVDSGVYTRTLGSLRAGCEVHEIGCPLFVPLVESERGESAQAVAAALKYLGPLLESRCDTIILGCTHFPLLLPVLRSLAPHIRFIDPAHAVAQEVASAVPTRPQVLGEPVGAREADIFFVSGEREGVRHWIQNLMGVSNPRLEAGPVFEREQIEPAQARQHSLLLSQ